MTEQRGALREGAGLLGAGTRLLREGAGLLREASRAVVPLVCAGCGAWDHVLCPACDALLVPQRLDGEAPGLRGDLPVWGLGSYRGEVRRTVLGWKTGGRRDLERIWRDRLARAGALALSHAPQPAMEAVWVVPAPSSVRRVLAGRPGVHRLAAPVAQGLAHAGRDAAVVTALGLPLTQVRGHRGANAQARRAGTPVLVRVPLAGRDVVLVDDVLTTGGTLQRCVDAVTTAGGRVLGAVVLAAARSPGRAGPWGLSPEANVD